MNNFLNQFTCVTTGVRLLTVTGLSVGIASLASLSAQAVVLFDENFDTPVGYIGTALNGDLSGQTVNSLHGTSFQNSFTVETMRIASGTTFSDPSGTGGAYALGMLSSPDLVSAVFDAQSFNFLNLNLDISAIDLDCCGGPFNPTATLIPEFEFRLYDAPLGVFNLFAPGTLLDSDTIIGTASDRTTFAWTNHTVALDASSSTDGNVALVIDLLQGGYASFDNLVIASSNDPGGGVSVPEPSSVLGLLAASALGASSTLLSRKKHKR